MPIIYIIITDTIMDKLGMYIILSLELPNIVEMANMIRLVKMETARIGSRTSPMYLLTFNPTCFSAI